MQPSNKVTPGLAAGGDSTISDGNERELSSSLMIPDLASSRTPLRSGDGELYPMLIALGFQARERVSICTRLSHGEFVSTLVAVGQLAGWTPPRDRDVWFSINPVGRHVQHGRGTERDITRVRALFADLDVKPGKQFDKLDGCHEAARSLANYLGVAPVVLVESGHGLQPIWRVASPRGDSNVVDRDRSRDEWKNIYQRWGAVVQQAARDAQWSPDGAQNMRTIDNVFNLDRVLRCPGSINWKNTDHPVPVRSFLLADRGRVLAHELTGRLDREGVRPLATVRPTTASIPTTWGEATEWVRQQRGAEAELEHLLAQPRDRVLAAYLDPVPLMRVIADGDGGAHATMRDKVLHAVYSSQEGRAGLVLALNNIGSAYLEVMEARASGELAGDARSAATAMREIEGAVIGAVAKARGRVVTRAVGRQPRRPTRPRRPRRERSA